MTRLIAIIFVFVFFCESQGQTYLAGQNLTTYVDISPDTLINYSCVNHYSETYYFDVNGDWQNDFKINAYCSISPGLANGNIMISSLTPNATARFERLDSAYHNYYGYWMTAKVAKPLAYGDTINSAFSKWESAMYLFKFYSTAGSGISVKPDWLGATDKYIGIKYQTANDTIYGWIRVNCPSTASCNIKDYSLGGKTIGIMETVINSDIRVYPNPSNNKIVIEYLNNEAIELKMYDVVGREVSISVKSNNPITEIDVSGLPNGIYFLQGQNNDCTINKKILVQH